MLSIKSLFLKGLTDQELLEKYRSTNNTIYFGELFKRYSFLVLATCKKILLDRDLAKDAVMQIFEKIMEDGVEEKVYNFSSWIHVVSRNHCLMKLRKDKNRKHVSLDEASMDGRMWMEADIHDDTQEHYHQHLEACFKKLNEAQQKCVDLFFLKENPYKIITTLTGFSIDQVKSYVQNGKRNLKICLEGKVLK